MQWHVVISILVLSYVLIIGLLHILFPEKHLNWNQINTDDLNFPETFTWGVATASHQIEGNNVNNWTQFEERENKNPVALLVTIGIYGSMITIYWSS